MNQPFPFWPGFSFCHPGRLSITNPTSYFRAVCLILPSRTEPISVCNAYITELKEGHWADKQVFWKVARRWPEVPLGSANWRSDRVTLHSAAARPSGARGQPLGENPYERPPTGPGDIRIPT